MAPSLVARLIYNIKGMKREVTMGQFTRDTTFTMLANILILMLGLGTSVILARLLGPEGRGIYAIASLLPSLVVTFVHLGIGPAAVYYTAQKRYPWKEILGNTIFLALITGVAGVIVALIVTLFFRERIFPNIASKYLLIAIGIIPLNLFFLYLRYILLGAQRIREYNVLDIWQSFCFLALVTVALWGWGLGVVGALWAAIISWLLAAVLAFLWAWKVADGISLQINLSYIRDVSVYGIQAYLASILGFLNYRLDMLLVNWFLNPTAVGLYSISVGIAEKLWLVSQAASVVLFPRVASETDELKREEFTPLVTRTVFWGTALAALLLFFLVHYVIAFLYSEEFLPAVRPLQILLPGIVTLSAWRLLANDLAGRGKPMINTYITGVAVVVNLMLNLLLIPHYGLEGAAWASTASYSIALSIVLAVYCHLSGNQWTKVILPQRGDWALYWRTGAALGQWLKAMMRMVL